MKLVFTIVLTLAFVNIFSQVGPDSCTDATSLAVNSSCLNTFFQNFDDGTTDAAVSGSCATGSNYADVWYSFTGTGNSVQITLSPGTNPNRRNACLTIWSDCSYTTQLACTMVNSGATGSVTISTTLGNTYYIQIQRRSPTSGGGASSANMDGNICLIDIPPAPSNDDPCGAVTLPVNTSCAYTSGTNVSATVSSGIPAPGCGAGAYNDVWFSLTVPASGSIVINTEAGTMNNADMAIYSAATCAGPFTLIECDNLDGPGNMPFISASGLTPGSTLWIRVWGNGGTTGTFNICAVQPPANDNPCQAVSLTINDVCSETSGTNVNATATVSPTPPAPGCGLYAGGDVWYSVVVPASGILIVNTSAGTLTDAAMAIYSGATCSGTLTLIECDDDDGVGNMPYIYRTGLTPGATIWIRVWGYNGASGTFNICVTQPPANDDPCGAITLPVSTDCNYTTGSNLGATATAGVPAPGCGSYSTADVWFTITVPASGNLVISTIAGTITDGAMAIYSGTCGSLTLITCNDDLDATAGFSMPLIYLTSPTVSPGQTLWIRIWDYFDGQGTFGICALETFIDPDDNQDCVDVERLCGNDSFNDNSNGEGVVTDLDGTNEGCLLSLENQSAWYAFRIETSGTFTFTIDPVLDLVSDFDFGLWGPFTGLTCPPAGDPIRCSWALGTGSTGLNTTALDTSEDDVCGTCDGFVAYLDVVVDEIYFLMVDNYTPTYTGFDISFGGTATLDCLLPVSLLTFTGIVMSSENLLQWSTATETNNSHFEIEKSHNGIEFIKFGTLMGEGNSTETLHYNFKDKTPFPEITYYRLKQVDFDGHSEYSKIIAVVNNTGNYFKVFPNPSADGNITISYSGFEQPSVRIAIYNATGQEIFTEIVSNPESFNQMQFKLPAKGMYTVIFSAGKYTDVKKLVY